MTRRSRQGFSLLEVLLATAILIGSAIVLLELATIGGRHASMARDLSRSQLICQSKLSEVLAKIAPAEPVRPMPVDEEPGWVYWIDVQPLKQPGLMLLEVSAARETKPGKQTARFTLSRWIRDPQMSKQLDQAAPADGDVAAGDAVGGSRP